VIFPVFNDATHVGFNMSIILFSVGTRFNFGHEGSTLLFLHVHMSCLVVPQPLILIYIDLVCLFNYCVHFS
jgi:hypothetical protein